MGKLSKSEFLQNVRSIINEGLERNAEHDASDKFTIKRYVNSLIGEGSRNPNLMNVLVGYDNRIKAGEPEYMMYESFGHDIARHASGNRSIKGIIAEMNRTLKESGNELETFMLLEGIGDAQARETIRGAYNDYLFEQDDITRGNLIDAIDALYYTDGRSADRLKCLIAESASVREIPVGINESEYADISKEIIKSNEQKKMRDIQDKIMDYASEYFDKAIAEAKEEKMNNTLSGIANNTGINLRKAVAYITKNAGGNRRLMEQVEQYAGAISNGLYEERLYESFVNAMSQYTYLAPVEKAVRMVNENVRKNRLGVTITKVLEEMSESMSYYIVPLIEEDCARFVNEQTPTNRVQMRNALMPFAADPYVNYILNELEKSDMPDTSSLSEKALSIKDQIKLIRENASVNSIYSPIQYIKENECVFNVNGDYFVKKGNTIMKFNEKYIDNLSDKFVSLCQLCNDPRVVIDEDVIYLSSGSKIAEIHEGYVDINGSRESRTSLRDLNEMCNKYDYDTNFFIMASVLHENFNNIAKVGFAKHITLKNNNYVYADLFRINDNIFINTVNEQLAQTTFYKNVNPIQCRNILNKHMGMNVANLFEDLLPSQNRILLKLNETKNEYENAISEYEDTIDELEEAKDACKDGSNKEKLEAAIKEANKKLEALKSEYKKWQKEAKKATGEDEDDVEDDETSDDGATRQQTTDEPLKTDDEVEDAMPDLTTPIEASDDDDATEDDEEISDDDDEFTAPTDDEFADMLNGEDGIEDDEEVSDEEDYVEGDDEFAEIGDDEDEFSGDEDFDGSDDIDDDATEDDDFDGFDMTDDGDFSDDEEDGYDFDGEASDDEEDGDEFEYNDEATDLFGGDVDDPLNQNAEDNGFSDDETEADNGVWEISQIRFDENLKTGVKYKSGSVSVMTPMISRKGETYMENATYEFYLDDETGEPVINNDEMEVSLYKQIISAIKSCPEYSDFVENGESNPNIDADDFIGGGDDDEEIDSNDMFTFTDTDDEFSIESNDEDGEDDDLLFGDDEDDAIKTFLAQIPVEKKAVKRATAPTYKSGETDIELPAADADGTAIPESRKSAARGSVNESKRSRILGMKPKFRR